MKVKNLIIHPKDKSTTFLSPIYKRARAKTVLQKNSSLKEVKALMDRSERVMMMGHGSPSGLYSVRQFKNAGSFIIGSDEVAQLKRQKENIYIWCHADKFVEFHDLKGFYSGMFVSEVREAIFCGVTGVTQDVVDESNDGFSEIVGKHIRLPVAELYEKVMEEYGVLALTNPVAKYNHERLYLR